MYELELPRCSKCGAFLGPHDRQVNGQYLCCNCAPKDGLDRLKAFEAQMKAYEALEGPKGDVDILFRPVTEESAAPLVLTVIKSRR